MSHQSVTDAEKGEVLVAILNAWRDFYMLQNALWESN
jgi:hypothetical protein